MSTLNFSQRVPVAIIGANGYAGMELARLLLKHPYVQLKACVSRRPGWKLEDELPELSAAEVPTLSIEAMLKEKDQHQTVFLATPPETSLELTPFFLNQGVQVIDLSGAFRLDPISFEKNYGLSHPAPELIQKAHYGLVPWNSYSEKSKLPLEFSLNHFSKITTAMDGESCVKTGSLLSRNDSAKMNRWDLISNPGCYATSVLMALIPLLKDKLIDPSSIVIDSKSGTSGAGLKPKENLLFNEVAEDCLPYRVGSHQHLPEIISYVRKFSQTEIDPHFSTSLLPTRRGIISALYAKLKSPLKERDSALTLIDQSFSRAYQNYSLVKFGKLGESESKDKMYLSLKKVTGSCRTHISYTINDEKLYLFSTLDNLLKGAASQAVENWNASHGFPVDTGLIEREGQL